MRIVRRILRASDEQQQLDVGGKPFGSRRELISILLRGAGIRVAARPELQRSQLDTNALPPADRVRQRLRARRGRAGAPSLVSSANA